MFIFAKKINKMSTTTKKNKKIALSGGNSLKTDKKLTKKQKNFISMMKEAQEIGAKLYAEGKIDVFNRVK